MHELADNVVGFPLMQARIKDARGAMVHVTGRDSAPTLQKVQTIMDGVSAALSRDAYTAIGARDVERDDDVLSVTATPTGVDVAAQP